MNNCPNPNYDIKCPFALSIDSPLPCWASQEQCKEYRNKLIEIKKENNNDINW